MRRDDLLLAGDQRDLVGADAGGDAVIDLARQQPERQADHAGRVAEHPLDGEMGLAGIGGPEHGDDVAAADRQAALAGLMLRRSCGADAARSSPWPAAVESRLPVP